MSRAAVDDPERLEAPGAEGLAGLSWRRLADLGPERLVAVVLVVGAVGFTGTGLARLVQQHDIDVVTLPLALLAADLLIAAALVTGWYPIRPVAQGLAIFGALVHVLVLLRSGAWWIRGWSGLLAVAHVSALVLFFSLSAREYDEDDEDGDDAVEGPPGAEPAMGALDDQRARSEVAETRQPVESEPRPAVDEKPPEPAPVQTARAVDERRSEPEPAGDERPAEASDMTELSEEAEASDMTEPSGVAETVDTESADTESVDAESVDTESVDTESVDTESADTESADTESADTESADTESADTETADAETTDRAEDSA